MSVNYYEQLSRLLHWVMASVISYALSAGYAMHLVMDSHPAIFHVLSVLNMSLATVGTVLFIVRVIWRYFRSSPEVEPTLTKHHVKVAHFAHSALYFMMFLVFLSGFLMLEKPYTFFWVVQISNPISSVEINQFFFSFHRYSCLTLMLLVGLHAAAAIMHHKKLKNNVLRRMISPRTGSMREGISVDR